MPIFCRYCCKAINSIPDPFSQVCVSSHWLFPVSVHTFFTPLSKMQFLQKGEIKCFLMQRNPSNYLDNMTRGCISIEMAFQHARAICFVFRLSNNWTMLLKVAFRPKLCSAQSKTITKTLAHKLETTFKPCNKADMQTKHSSVA